MRIRTVRILAARAAYLGTLTALLAGWLRPGVGFPQDAAAPRSDQAEVTTGQATEPTFKLKSERNLVTVRVVVRDRQGNAVGALHKEDFRLLDNGKPQSIVQFSVEVPQSKKAIPTTPKENAADNESQDEATSVASAPERFLALYFDDVHISFQDIVYVREAAKKYFATSIKPGDRVGVMTSSGQGMIEFTEDQAKIYSALLTLRPRPVVPREATPCPDISPYQAFMMVDQRDAKALEIAAEEVLQCRYNNDRRLINLAQQDAESSAVRLLSNSETESEASLRGLEQLVSRMGRLPGQRNIALISPGFMIETQRLRISDIIDRALRLKVVVNTLDSQGLAAFMPLGDASARTSLPKRADLVGGKVMIQLNEFDRNSDVLAEIAASTGGVFYHNSNDMDAGFRRIGALPDVYYTLAFSPQNLKLDGKFHNLKITLDNSKGLTVQARRGYFAPSQSADPATRAQDEIREAIFSQDEMNELPIDVHTQFFRVNDTDAKLVVVTRVDAHFIGFHKQEGRNTDNLTLVTALFDRDGKYVTGMQKDLQLRLRDVSLDRLRQSGISMQSSFDVKPGAYLIREVVRDEGGAQISGTNRAVEIPY